jgi:hypothetical protein
MVSSVCELHSIVKVAKHFYVAIAKGGINDAHMLLVPVQHVPSSLALARDAIEELLVWKEAFVKMFNARDLNVIFCEHNQPGFKPDLQHLIYQVIGLPKATHFRQYLEHVSGREGLDWNQFNANENPMAIQTNIRAVSGNSSYIWIHIPHDTVHLIGAIEREKFPHSFFRRAVCNAIDHPELEDWKRCVQHKREEEKSAKALREELTKYCPETL